MGGIDLSVKLRKGLGDGNVLTAEEIEQRLASFDGDGDRKLTRGELAAFFQKHRIGGPWFSQAITKNLWAFVEDRTGQGQESIGVELLSKIIHQVMRAPPRPSERYVITPEVMIGLEPKKPLRPPPPDAVAADGNAAPRASPRGGPLVTPPRGSQLPGRGGGPGGAAARAPLGRRPAPRRPGPRK